MKILSTSDWHLGNIFHSNDRLQEHKHFLAWLLQQIEQQQPDALLVAGDVFDNGNPSAAAQSAYYEFLADATKTCPSMQIVITAGNHDSANRLEAPRALLSRYKVEVRGTVRRDWVSTEDGNEWVVNFDDLIIPVDGTDGGKAAILAVPYLRSDMLQGSSYSNGVNAFLRVLTIRARELYPDRTLVMMAHMYANGAEIATRDASEKIIIGGQEEVNMEGWTDHPDYLTCGHIHKRQKIWNTDWARYTGSVLPMSFAEKDYSHGVDMIVIENGKIARIDFLEYTPQHALCILPENDEELTPEQLKKLINSELEPRVGNKPGDDFKYVVLKVKVENINNDEIKELVNLVNSKNAVHCKTQKIMPQIDLSTISDSERLGSIDDILNRDPMDTLKEAFFIKHKTEMSEQQKAMLKELLDGIKFVED